MPEKKTRRKLFKIAKELNLSHETISEFLDKKGYTVAGLNTPITDKMYEDILKRFSQEKLKAEKLERRKQERIHEEEEETTLTSETVGVEGIPVSEVVDTKSKQPEKLETEGKEDKKLSDEDLPGSEEQISEDEFTETKAEVNEGKDADRISPEAKEKEQTKTADDSDTEIDSESKITEIESGEKKPTFQAPEIGDIVDHPMAKEFIERQKKQDRRKAEKKKDIIKKIKEETEQVEREDTDKTKPDQDQEMIPRRIRAIEKEEAKSIEELAKEEQIKPKRRKDRKKKAEPEDYSEKERRRRKAFEMIRKEGRKGKMKMPQIDEELDETILEPEDRRRRGRKKREVDEQEVEDTLKKTLASMQEGGTGRKRKKKVKTSEEDTVGENNIISVTEFITVQDLANLMSVPVAEVIKKCLELGQMVTINQRLDMDMIKLLTEDFGFRIQEEEEFASDFLEETLEEKGNPEDYVPRHPVVTVMGHVDHGKTSLLDYIRKTNVVAGESGGITQHIGAYVVKLDDDRKITFLDTPGHEAFTAMRSRGAQITDIVVLVVAADDRIMPQTEEALDHSKAAGVPIVIAINKIDKPNADPQAVRKQLADRDILVEDWGGQYQAVDVSAKTGEGIQDILEKILLEAELLEKKANPKKRATGIVIESRLDKGKGTVATVLVDQGTLRVGDDFLAGQYYGRVRALLNERNQRLDEAGPGFPVQVLGTDGVPEAGDKFIAMADERTAREIANRRQQLKREQDFRQIKFLTLDEISRQIKEGEVKELNIIVKADVDGSAQALTDSLLKLSKEDVAVKVVRRAVGPITESDVMLASASEAIIIGFHVRSTLKAKELADQEKVDIRLYKVIYDAIEDVKNALEGLLEPEERERILGLVEIREVFKISRLGTVAGCYVLDGQITRNASIRLIRNDVEIYEGKLASLKRFKDDVKESGRGYECGIMVENYNDLKVGDHIEAFEVVHEKRTLES